MIEFGKTIKQRDRKEKNSENKEGKGFKAKKEKLSKNAETRNMPIQDLLIRISRRKARRNRIDRNIQKNIKMVKIKKV